MGYLAPNALVTIKGKIGHLYIAEHNGKLVVKTCPHREPAEPTQAERHVRDQLQVGNRYWAQVKNDPNLKKAYTDAAPAKKKRAVDLAKADAMKPPVVQDIDLSGYRGDPNGIARVKAEDDFEVVQVHLRILELDGTVIEEGDAAMDPEAETWVYSVKTAQPPGKAVVFEVTARDRPGNKVVKKVDHICGAR
jgi:hypothetical protein